MRQSWIVAQALTTASLRKWFVYFLLFSPQRRFIIIWRYILIIGMFAVCWAQNRYHFWALSRSRQFIYATSSTNWTIFIGDYSFRLSGNWKRQNVFTHFLLSQKIPWQSTVCGHLHISATGIGNIGPEVGEWHLRVEVQVLSAKQHQCRSTIRLEFLWFLLIFVFVGASVIQYTKSNALLFSRNPFVLRDDEWKENRADLSPAFTTLKVRTVAAVVWSCLYSIPHCVNQFDLI